MVNPRRVLALTRRELTHQTNLASLAGFTAIAAAAAAFGLAEAGARTFAHLTFLVLPALACPLVAGRVAADREQGMARVQASAPLTPTEALLARLGAHLVLLVVALLSALPALYAFTGPVAAGAFQASLGLVPWALVIGLASLLVGLLVGHLHDGTSTGAMSLAATIVLAWLLIVEERGRLLALAQEGPQALVLEAILKANPLVWALEAQHASALGPQTHHVTALGSLLALVAFLLVVTVALVLGTQHRNEARPLGLPYPAMASVGIGLAGLLLTLPIVSLPAAPPEPGGIAAPGGAFELRLDANPQEPWQRSTAMTIQLDVTGPLNRSVTLEQLSLNSPHLALDHELATPTKLVLEEPTGREGEQGLARLETTATAQPSRVATSFPIEATASLDGDPVQARSQAHATGWATPAASLLLASLLPLLLTASLAFFGPRRWNRW